MNKPKFEQSYLGFTIRDTGRGILLISDCFEKTWPSLVGYHGAGDDPANVERAQRYAIIFLMISCPEYFAGHLAGLIMSNLGNNMAYGALWRLCKEEGIEMPSNITESEGLERHLLHNGVPMHQWLRPATDWMREMYASESIVEAREFCLVNPVLDPSKVIERRTLTNGEAAIENGYYREQLSDLRWVPCSKMGAR